MLHQLLEDLSKIPSVVSKFTELQLKASTPPVTPQDIMELVRLCRYEMNVEEFPALNQEEILQELGSCRQVLVQTEDYFFI